MKVKLLAVTAAMSATVLAGCATNLPEDSVSRDQYNAEIAKRDAELANLRSKVSKNASTTTQSPVTTPEGLNSELFPPNPQPGHCYARLLTPAKFKTEKEKVLISEASESVKVLPATFKTVQERVLVREASTRIEAVPATFKTVTERVLVKPESTKLIPYDAKYGKKTERILVKEASTKLVAVPATYETVTERVIDKPAHTVWKRGERFRLSALQTSYDQSTGEIMCLVEVPATYKTVTKKVLKTPATTRTVEVPAVYKTVSQTVLDAPAGYKEVKVPAEYKTITKTVIDKPATTRKVTIPAEYRTVSVQKIATPAKQQRTAIPAKYGTVDKRRKISEEKLAWAEVICQDNINDGLITRIQTALSKQGHYNGPIDGLYGPQTRSALNKFSNEKNLAKSGAYIPLSTAKLLGVSL